MEPTTRKQFLRRMGGVALGAVAVTSAAGLASCVVEPEASPPELPWPYRALDPIEAAEHAYASYYQGGCMYGVYEGIIGTLREVVGAPYTMLPTVMMKYGAAGVAGWGSLCGALNGAAATIYLVSQSNAIISEVFGWYGLEALPNYKPSEPKFDEIMATVAETQLCHASVTRWCNASGFKAGDPQRAERCGWLTASVAKYTVELLNQQAEASALSSGQAKFDPSQDIVINPDEPFTPTYGNSEEVTACLSCHGSKGPIANVHASKQTSCTACHFGLAPEHP